MFKTYLMSAAVALVAGVSASASAAPAQAPRAAAPAAQAQQPATRAGVLKNVDAAFKSVDTNGDGLLTQAEIAAAEARNLQGRVAAARQRMEAEFTKLDTNKDGQLSKAEFMAAAPQAPTTAPNGADVLAVLDKNKDGKVALEEYRAPIIGRFDAIDTNHDGTISEAERKAAQAAAPKKK